MRIALVGTELAPARAGAGALETLLDGWAAALAAGGDEVHLIGAPGTAAGADAAVARHELAHHPAGLDALVARLAPDVVVLNNRPAWQALVRTATLHLMHNWPDAWQLGERPPAALVGQASAAAVSGPLAAVVASALGRPGQSVAVVPPFAGDAFTRVEPDPQPGLVLSPNRLLAKKGVRELVAASRLAALDGHQILVTDYLSPWRHATAEHDALRAVVTAAPRCRLVPPPTTRPAMAALLARASAVVVPSIRPEGFGMAAVEAQAVGVPVVTSGLGGLAEATLPPSRVVDPHDPDALAAAIVAVAGVGGGARLRLRDEARRHWSAQRSVTALRAALGAASAGPPAGRISRR